jgi:hypothetical protein
MNSTGDDSARLRPLLSILVLTIVVLSMAFGVFAGLASLLFAFVLATMEGWPAGIFQGIAWTILGAGSFFALLPGLLLLRFDRSSLLKVSLLVSGASAVVLLIEVLIVQSFHLSAC